MKIDIADNIQEVTRNLGHFSRKQAPFALSLALNNTAADVQAEEKHEILDVFDNPTRYTQNSVFKTRATKKNLEVTVGLKDGKLNPGKGIPAAKFLHAQIVGGSRSLKRFEVALRSVGVLPNGYYIVPGEGAKKDRWGNMARGQIVQILSYFKSFSESGFRANMTDKRKASLKRGGRKTRGMEYFVVRPGEGSRLHPGIWQRVGFGFGKAIKPIMIFVRHATYEENFDFEFVAINTIKKNFNKNLDRAFEYAERTAKR